MPNREVLTMRTRTRWLASAAASGIVESAGVVETVPALSWRVPPPGMRLLVIYYSSLLVALFAKAAWLRLAAVPVLGAALLWVIGVVPKRQAPPVHGLRLTLLDVGQGEAMLFESGTSRLQIDTGGVPFGSGRFDIGTRVVAPALWGRGVSRLDAVKRLST